MSQKTKVIAAICIVALIAIVSIVIFRKYPPPKTYSLTATDDPNGSVTKSPDQASYKHGETVTLKAVPNKGCRFTKWSGDLSGSTNPATIKIDSNKSITASFALKTYSLTATADPNGSVTKDPDKTSYEHGETVTLEADPNTGYSFTNWSDDLSGNTNPAKLVMDADKSVKANFALKTYSLTATADPNGSVTKDPDKTNYKHGDEVTLKAVPNEGYVFTNWSCDLSGSNNPATLDMDANKSVTASFALKTYSLTILALDGSVTKDPNKVSYKDGETVILGAVPNTGYSFTNWSDNLSGDSNPATLVMDADKSVTASFALKTYSLTILALDGSVTKDPNKVSYKDVETVILGAKPNEGYSFMNWSGDLDGSTNPATLVMDEDKLVTASFALKEVDVATNSIGMKLVYIPAGSFMMGSSSSAAQLAREYDTKEVYFTDEFPQHQVRISEGFWMGLTEVTQGQYKSVMIAQPWSGKACVQESANNPAVYVSWYDAVEFCRKLSQQEGKTYRLPTEAEWEYACRAGTTTRFSFGDSHLSIDDYAWHRNNAYQVGQEYPHSVGQKKPNPWGLYEMHGNVWEWCNDWYDRDYYSNSPSVDPKGPSSGTTRRSLRGGSWNLVESNLRCSVRDYYNPINRYSSVIGFRVVRSQ